MNKLNSIALIIVIILSVLSLTVFTVYQTDLAIILRFNKIKTKNNNPIFYKPGLHFKMPFIDHVIKFDMRANVLDVKTSKITTLENKEIWIDYYVLWRIKNIVKYYNRTQSMNSKTELLLEYAINSILKNEISRLNIREIVSNFNSVLIKNRLHIAMNSNLNDLGIEVIDVRIKYIDLPKKLSSSIYSRMRDERQLIANTLRADGHNESITIRAEANRIKVVTLANAKQKANKIRGEGDAQALSIYSKAYRKAPKFFEFYKNMEAYKESFKDKTDLLLLKPEGDFFKFFNNIDKNNYNER